MSLERKEKEKGYSSDERRVSFSLPRGKKRFKDMSDPAHDDSSDCSDPPAPPVVTKPKKKWKIKLPWKRNKKRKVTGVPMFGKFSDFEGESDCQKQYSSSESDVEKAVESEKENIAFTNPKYKRSFSWYGQTPTMDSLDDGSKGVNSAKFSQAISVEVLEEHSDEPFTSNGKSKTKKKGSKGKYSKFGQRSSSFESSSEDDTQIASKKNKSKKNKKDKIHLQRKSSFRVNMSQSQPDLMDSEDESLGLNKLKLNKRFSNSEYTEKLNFIELDEPEFNKNTKENKPFKKSNSLPSIFFRKKKKNKESTSKKSSENDRKYSEGSFEAFLDNSTDGTPDSLRNLGNSKNILKRDVIIHSSPEPQPSEVIQQNPSNSFNSKHSKKSRIFKDSHQMPRNVYEEKVEINKSTEFEQNETITKPSIKTKDRKSFSVNPERATESSKFIDFFNFSKTSNFGKTHKTKSASEEFLNPKNCNNTFPRGSDLRIRRRSYEEMINLLEEEMFDHEEWSDDESTDTDGDQVDLSFNKHLDKESAERAQREPTFKLRTLHDCDSSLSETELVYEPKIASKKLNSTLQSQNTDIKNSKSLKRQSEAQPLPFQSSQTGITEERKLSSNHQDSTGLLKYSFMVEEKEKTNKRNSLQLNPLQPQNADLKNSGSLKRLSETQPQAYQSSQTAVNEEKKLSNDQDSNWFLKYSNRIEGKTEKTKKLNPILPQNADLKNSGSLKRLSGVQPQPPHSSQTAVNEERKLNNDHQNSKLLLKYSSGVEEKEKTKKLNPILQPQNAGLKKSPSLKRPSGAPPNPPQLSHTPINEGKLTNNLQDSNRLLKYSNRVEEREKTKKKKLKKMKKIRSDFRSSSCSSLEESLSTNGASKTEITTPNKLKKIQILAREEHVKDKASRLYSSDSESPPSFSPPPIPNINEDKTQILQTEKNNTLNTPLLQDEKCTDNTVSNNNKAKSASVIAKDLFTKRDENKSFLNDYNDIYLTNLPIKNIKSSTAFKGQRVNPPPPPVLPPPDEDPFSKSLPSLNLYNIKNSQPKDEYTSNVDSTHFKSNVENHTSSSRAPFYHDGGNEVESKNGGKSHGRQVQRSKSPTPKVPSPILLKPEIKEHERYSLSHKSNKGEHNTYTSFTLPSGNETSKEAKKQIVTFHLPPTNALPSDLTITYHNLPQEQQTYQNIQQLQRENEITYHTFPKAEHQSSLSTSHFTEMPRSSPLVQRQVLSMKQEALRLPYSDKSIVNDDLPSTHQKDYSDVSEVPMMKNKMPQNFENSAGGLNKTFIKASGPIPYSKSQPPLKSILRNSNRSLNLDNKSQESNSLSNVHMNTKYVSSHGSEVTSVYRQQVINKLVHSSIAGPPVYSDAVERVEIVDDSSESDSEILPSLPNYPPPPPRPISSYQQQFLGSLLQPTDYPSSLHFTQLTDISSSRTSNYIPTVIESRGQRGELESVYQNVIHASQV